VSSVSNRCHDTDDTDGTKDGSGSDQVAPDGADAAAKELFERLSKGKPPHAA